MRILRIVPRVPERARSQGLGSESVINTVISVPFLRFLSRIAPTRGEISTTGMFTCKEEKAGTQKLGLASFDRGWVGPTGVMGKQAFEVGFQGGWVVGTNLFYRVGLVAQECSYARFKG